MGLPNAPRGGGGGRAYVHCPYVSTDKGERWGAWIAGPCQWFNCHCSTRTKPCVELMTEGQLTCSICSATKVPQVIGYQPLYRKLDGRPVHVIIYELQREVIERLKLHQQVTVGRHTGASDTVFITPLLGGGPPYMSTLAERMRPLDLTETLLRMWAIPELTDWYRRTHGKTEAGSAMAISDNVVSLKNRMLDGVPGTIGDVIDLALGEKADAVESLKRKQEAMRRGEAAARNGKHKPKGE